MLGGRMSEEIRLRPHHVLQIVAYKLNPGLIKEYVEKRYDLCESSIVSEEVISRINDDTPIILVEAEDDVCDICKYPTIDSSDIRP